jgi:hypothetical protein
VSGWWRFLFFVSCFFLGWVLARKTPPGGSILGFRPIVEDMLWLKVGRWMVTIPVYIRGQHLVVVWPFVKRFNQEGRPWMK